MHNLHQFVIFVSFFFFCFELSSLCLIHIWLANFTRVKIYFPTNLPVLVNYINTHTHKYVFGLHDDQLVQDVSLQRQLSAHVSSTALKQQRHAETEREGDLCMRLTILGKEND